MIVTIDPVLEVLGSLADGSEVKMAAVHNEERIIGRLIDFGNGVYRADYIDVEGEVCEAEAHDLYTAVQTITDAALARARVLN